MVDADRLQRVVANYCDGSGCGLALVGRGDGRGCGRRPRADQAASRNGKNCSVAGGHRGRAGYNLPGAVRVDRRNRERNWCSHVDDNWTAGTRYLDARQGPNNSVGGAVTGCIGWRRYVGPAVSHRSINGAISGDIGPAGLGAAPLGRRHISANIEPASLSANLRSRIGNPDVRDSDFDPGVGNPNLARGIPHPAFEPGIRAEASFEAPIRAAVPRATSVAGKHAKPAAATTTSAHCADQCQAKYQSCSRHSSCFSCFGSCRFRRRSTPIQAVCTPDPHVRVSGTRSLSTKARTLCHSRPTETMKLCPPPDGSWLATVAHTIPLPGFMMPLGSSACLIRRIRSISTALL